MSNIVVMFGLFFLRTVFTTADEEQLATGALIF